MPIQVGIMHVQRVKSKRGHKTYEQILLRESYREPGAKRSAVKKRTLLNLTKYSPQIVHAIELALKHQGDLSALTAMSDIALEQGPAVGAVFTLLEVARRLGIEKALGTHQNGKLALWQVIARAHSQGSRLSAVRLAKTTAAADIIGFALGFCEDNLYENLTWLCENQEAIEKRLFAFRRGQRRPELFLYDVTSSYLEGDHNALADWGYNRDKKRGKKQIVIGLLCDEGGEPVSVEVFVGNTTDPQTFGAQVKKAAERFGCRRVTFVGDRGMIKSTQIEDLESVDFHYITAITKAQIRSMIKKGVFQLELFDRQLCEVQDDGVRYVLRRNPLRAKEMAASRASKLAALQSFANAQNRYLAEHPRADDYVACYALKTDLPVQAADKELIHSRYKDLALVETAFCTCKTQHLEVRPVFVRTEVNTRGHVLVVMLAYRIIRALKQAWKDIDVTVEEGLQELDRICAMQLSVKGGGACLRIPEPSPIAKELLNALDMKLPLMLAKSKVEVDTKKKLASRRKR